MCLWIESKNLSGPPAINIWGQAVLMTARISLVFHHIKMFCKKYLRSCSPKEFDCTWPSIFLFHNQLPQVFSNNFWCFWWFWSGVYCDQNFSTWNCFWWQFNKTLSWDMIFKFKSSETLLTFIQNWCLDTIVRIVKFWQGSVVYSNRKEVQFQTLLRNFPLCFSPAMEICRFDNHLRKGLLQEFFWLFLQLF